MAQDKNKQVSQITDMDVDFAQWYTDVCTKAELIGYAKTKGMFILRPYGYAIWENIQAYLDRRFKETGHQNVSMPMLIPESLLQKEKDHIEGFAPECAWVTYGGSEKLDERMCIRPTSETLFCDHWADIVRSWRDLPMLYNQWCSVLRWEKTTRPFLRHREFLWQEGHTLHATAEEAIEETERMHRIYAELCEDVLAMPVVMGMKTDKEKFAGAERTYTIECMMHDKKALQNGTSHYFGDGFARAFGIAFADKNNRQTAPFETSWGITTRTSTGGAPDITWRELTTILIVDDVIPSIRQSLRSRFSKTKNTGQTRGAIRSQVIVELESKLRSEIIDSYGDVTVSVYDEDPTVCLVEFSFAVAHGLNQIYLTAHITI